MEGRRAENRGLSLSFSNFLAVSFGAIAQLGERVLCKHEVVGSIPSGSTRRFTRRNFTGATLGEGGECLND